MFVSEVGGKRGEETQREGESMIGTGSEIETPLATEKEVPAHCWMH